MGITDEFKIFDDEEKPKKYLSGTDFEGDGLKLEVVVMEKIKANEGYGANEADYLFKQGLLGKGETFRYTFLLDGEEKFYDTKSAVFFISMKNLDPSPKTKIIIKRSGKGKETKYDVNYAPLEKGEL